MDIKYHKEKVREKFNPELILDPSKRKSESKKNQKNSAQMNLTLDLFTDKKGEYTNVRDELINNLKKQITPV